nr:MAG TPA: hypothetical protein [Caudoviricetes sp.]
MVAFKHIAYLDTGYLGYNYTRMLTFDTIFVYIEGR